MTTSVRVINPETGVDVYTHVYGERLESVEVISTPDYAFPDPEIAWVKVIPSFRPGMPYDLSSYPVSWIRYLA